jgi:hypothetical protein
MTALAVACSRWQACARRSPGAYPSIIFELHQLLDGLREVLAVVIGMPSFTDTCLNRFNEE